MGVFRDETEEFRLEPWRVTLETTDFSGEKVVISVRNLKTSGS